MKKRTYLVAQVNYFANDAIQRGGTDNPDEAQAVLAQAEAHQDLRFHVTYPDGETLMVIPWEKVASVRGLYRIEDADAPTDTICGGVSRLKVTPSVFTVNNVTHNGVMVNRRADMPAASDFVSSVTYDGEEVEGWVASVDGLPDNTEQVGGYPVTVTVTYNDETQTFDATLLVRATFG